MLDLMSISSTDQILGRDDRINLEIMAENLVGERRYRSLVNAGLDASDILYLGAINLRTERKKEV